MNWRKKPYTYLPFRQHRNFRLLKLLPSVVSGQPRCSLVEYTIDEAPSYEAISYTWGEPTRTSQVLIDGKVFLVTTNLFLALQRCIRLLKKRFLWADAICINQEDLEERNQQVTLMKDIYQHADRVLVHLGPSAEKSEEMVRIFPLIINAVRQVLLKRNLENLVSDGSATIFPTEFVELGLPEPNGEDWDVMNAFFNRSWFVRAWTLQEVVVAKDLKFICGDWSMGWQSFFMIACCIKDARLPLTNVDSIHRILLMNKLGSGRSDFHSAPLIDILPQARRALSTDPRDSVFAYLGLSTESDATALKPDYGESLDEVYMRYARYFLTEGYGVPMLCECFMASTSQSSLPSWVAQWGRFPVLANNDTGNTLTAKGPLPTVSITNGIKELKVRSTVVDKLAAVGFSGGRPKWIALDLWAHWQQLRDTIEEMKIMTRNHSETYPTGETFRTAILLTLSPEFMTAHYDKLFDFLTTWFGALLFLEVMLEKKTPIPFHQGLSDQPDFSERVRILKRLKHEITSDTTGDGPGPVSEELSSLLKHAPPLEGENLELLCRDSYYFCSTTTYRATMLRSALTNRGYLSQVSPFAQAGDCIAFFAGAVQPFVLRPKAEEKHVPTKYQIVGQACVHGLDYDAAWEPSGTNDETIVII